MRTFTLIVLTLILWACFVPAAMAVGKITVDPNAGEVASAESAQPAVDKRLDQKVTYEARRKTVLAIMTELSAATGITFRAGYNNRDWQVRDRKMNIFAKDVVLRDLMDSMARVMKFKWKREGQEGEYNYRFFMDRKTLLDAENQALREEERLRQMETERRQKALDAYSKLDNLSPLELEKLKKENPFLYTIVQSGLTKSLGAFFGQVPAAADAIASGQEMTLSVGSLPLAGQQGLLKAMQDMSRLESRFSRRTRELPEDLAGNMAGVTIQINRNLEDMRGFPGANMMLGMMEMSYEGGRKTVPFIDPDSSMAQLLGKLMVRSQDEGKEIQDIAGNMQAEFMQAMMSDIKKTDTGEPVVEHGNDPALEAKIKLKADTRNLEDVEAAFAEASKMTVVSDSFGRTFGLPTLTQDETEIKVVLDKIAEGFHYNWDKPASVVELRDRNWFRKRSLQIPEEWLEGWRQTLKKTGTLDIGDLSQIAVLSQEQYNANISGDAVLESSGLQSAVFRARDILRLYAGLGEGERDALFAENGLDLMALDANQWPLAEKLINRRNASFLQGESAQIILAASRKRQDKQYEYTFTATSVDSDKPIEWKFTTPKYVEPVKKEEPKPNEAKPAK